MNRSRLTPGITPRTTKNRGTVYEARWRSPEGREVSRTFGSLAEARRWRTDQEQRKNRGEWIDPRSSRTTFGRQAEKWLQSSPSKRPSTLVTDHQVLNLVREQLADRSLGSITPLDLRHLIGTLIEAGYQPSTVRRCAAVVRAILNSAVDEDLIGRTPWRGIKLPADSPRERRALDPTDVAMLARECGSQYEALILMAALCGLRFGECAALRLADLRLDVGLVSVRHSAGEIGGQFVVSRPKSSSGERTMGMPDILVDVIGDHIGRFRSIANSQEFLFLGPNGGPLRYSNFRSRIFQPACQRLAMTDVTFHDLRRFNATMMVAAGIDIKTAQSRLGHSDPRLTLAVYAQATTQGDRLATRALDSVIRPSLCK